MKREADRPGHAAGTANVHVRLIFAPDLGIPARRAVLDAARAFGKFGVRFDHVIGEKSLMESPQRMAHPTKAGKLIHGAIRGEEINGIVTAGTDCFYDDITSEFSTRSRWADVYHKESLGMGVTPHDIIGYIPQLERSVGYPGSTLRGEAGIVSTYLGMELEPRLWLAAIRAVVKHELGHLLGRAGHCRGDSRGGCLMEQWAVNPQFIERVVKAGLDICGKCEAEIRSWVKSQRYAPVFKH